MVLLVGLATVCVVHASSQENGKPAAPPGQAKKGETVKGPKSKGGSFAFKSERAFGLLRTAFSQRRLEVKTPFRKQN